MGHTASFALYLSLLLAVADFGSCLRCYQCNSQSNPSCKDPFDGGIHAGQLVDCSSPEAITYNRNYLSTIFRDATRNDGIAGAKRQCHKIVLQTGTTIRTCLDVNPSDTFHTCRLLENSNPADPAARIKDCKSCDSDGCNGAASIIASLPLATLMALVSYLFYKQ